MATQGLNLLVFRDGRRSAEGSALVDALAAQLRFRGGFSDAAEVLSAFLRAGELESALADSGSDTAEFEVVTDSLAATLVDGSPLPDLKLLTILDRTAAPSRLAVSTPEGFAFYGLHPLAFSDAIECLPILSQSVVVVGIRSIGTTLSSITAAALRSRGIQAARTTVRPAGHPYNRYTEFSPAALQLVRTENTRGGMFLVVDEGPGLSGSSFLSAGEALMREGVPQERITLLCTHRPEADRLCAENAASRWRQFQCVAVPSCSRRPEGAQVWIGGGEWRRCLLRDRTQWPPSWLSHERLKYLGGQEMEPRFYKFAGFGSYGEQVLQREDEIAVAGYGPLPRPETDGYISYRFMDSRPMFAGDLTGSVISRLAAYCAFRARAFPAKATGLTALQQMVAHNLEELKLEGVANLRVERAVVPDARMQPYEWLLTGLGQILKTDSGSHGDDHFFPAATDIAWDLAGAIVEWQMSADQAAIFLEIYRRASGDNPQSRIADYITAYSVFRCAYCTMAAKAMQGTDEQARMENSAASYASALAQFAPAGLKLVFNPTRVKNGCQGSSRPSLETQPDHPPGSDSRRWPPGSLHDAAVRVQAHDWQYEKF